MPTDEFQNEQDTIIIEEPSIRAPYTLIPDRVLADPTLSPGAKLTYTLLLMHAKQKGSCFPGQVTLAEEMGAGERSIRRYMNELTEQGWLAVKRRGLGRTNVYRLLEWVRPRAAKLADQERPKTTVLERPNRPTEYYEVEKYEEEHHHDDVVTALEKFGVSSNQARRLARDHPPEVILEKLEVVEYLRATNSPLVARNAAGFLVRAVEDGYQKPKGFKSRADRDQEAASRAEQDQQRQIEEAALERARQARREAIKAFISGQPAKPIAGTTLTTSTAWAQVLERLKGQVNPLSFNTWLADTVLVSYQGGEAVIGTTSSFNAEQLETRLAPFLRKAIGDVVGAQSPPRLFFEVAQFHSDQEPAPTLSPGPS
jgi:hypothetical protein